MNEAIEKLQEDILKFLSESGKSIPDEVVGILVGLILHKYQIKEGEGIVRSIFEGNLHSFIYDAHKYKANIGAYLDDIEHFRIYYRPPTYLIVRLRSML